MLTVAILNYNGKDIIEGCVETVLRQTNPPDEILLIDNQSTDDSWKLVEKDVTRVVHCDNRHRFISGLNDSFNNAKDGDVVFLENDVFLYQNCLKEMLEDSADIKSPKFLDQFGKKYKVEWYSGFLSACFMMHKKVFKELGEFDVNLAPAYWEDVEYSIRAKRKGFKTKKNVGTAIHYANYSFSKKFTKKQMSGWCRRNAWYVLRKHYLGGLWTTKNT